MEQPDSETEPIHKANEWRILYPITTVKRIGNSGELNWYNSSVQIKIKPLTKQVKCKKIMYSFNRRNWYTYDKPFTITEEGTTPLYYYGVDFKNRHECINKVEIKIDKQAPTTSAQILGLQDGDGYYRSAVEVTLSVVANPLRSGLKMTEYSMDGETWSLYLKPLIINETGITTFYYRSIDLAGNTETANQKTIRIK